jgi:hypothetical protein
MYIIWILLGLVIFIILYLYLYEGIPLDVIFWFSVFKIILLLFPLIALIKIIIDGIYNQYKNFRRS